MNPFLPAVVARAAKLAPLALVAACITHTVKSDPIAIQPIHITMDINLRVQRELDDFFDFEKPAAPAAESTPTPKDKE
jgi:hypothetical protein